eukprot:148523_1
MSSSQKLIDAEESNASQSTRSRCIPILFYPIDLLMFPLIKCMNANCWSKRRYFQYDLAVQLCGIFQTLIGAMWSTLFLWIIQKSENKDTVNIALIATYVFVTYSMTNIAVIIMQRSSYFTRFKLAFFVQTLGEVVAFGIRDLLYITATKWFNDSQTNIWLFFWISCISAIIIIYSLSIIRKHFCFVMHKLRLDEQSIQLHLKHYASSLKDVISNKFVKPKQDITYESDFMDYLLHVNDEQQIDENKQEMNVSEFLEEDEETFNDFIKEIDNDSFMVAISFMFVQIILYEITDKWAPIGTDEPIHDQNTHIYTVIIVTALSIFILFWVFNFCISYIQMVRDRAIYKVFKTLKNSYRQSHMNISISNMLNIDENCCIGCCIKFSYKSYKLTENFIIFIIGFLGISFGWIVVSDGYFLDNVFDRFINAAVVTFGGIFFYFLRVTYLKFKLEKWKEMTRQNRIENDESKIDLFETKTRYHRMIYFISHSNYFVRKAYGLIFAMPWELTLDMIIENNFNYDSTKYVLRISITIAVTIILSYCAFQFMDKHKHQKESTSYIAQRFVRGNYMKIKQFM